jgi:hypothetical protein
MKYLIILLLTLVLATTAWAGVELYHAELYSWNSEGTPATPTTVNAMLLGGEAMWINGQEMTL